MSDARLQALYRRMTAQRDDTLDADALVEAMGRAGYPDAEATPLDRIAGSSAHADVLRTALELTPDAQAFARELSALRAPRRGALPARRWIALAAALGAVAVLVINLRPESSPTPVAVEAPRSEAIFSVSFESPSGPAQDAILSGSFESPGGATQDAEPIFRGDFDS